MGHRAHDSLGNMNGCMCMPSSHPQGKSRTALAWVHDFSCSVWPCLHYVAPLSRGREQRAFPLDPCPYTCNLVIVKYTILGLFLNCYLFWLFICPFCQTISKYKEECGSYFADVENCSQMAYALASFFTTPLPGQDQNVRTSASPRCACRGGAGPWFVQLSAAHEQLPLDSLCWVKCDEGPGLQGDLSCQPCEAVSQWGLWMLTFLGFPGV